ncbi:MAG: imidazole glycerol phosphate synthase subunit HisH [Myxococcales bacterium]|nr:imidazole glycerol phosphate synthase subunit HisH [Myxococcales bacterium]
MIVLVDYGSGNIRSVANAFEAIGAAFLISARPDDLRAADRIVLPGVGAFGEAMRRLEALGLPAVLTEEVVQKKKPFLGLCVGMQLLAERGHEHGEHRGLGWIRGEVHRIEPATDGDGKAFPVPHVGWNSVKAQNGSVLLRSMPAEPTFYFVHSYAFRAADPGVVAGTFDYGGEFSAVVEQGHIFGTQFHPEKSQKAGLQLLKNFLAYEAPC